MKPSIKILLGLLIILLIIQLFQVDKTNPAVEPAKDLIIATKAPEQVSGILKRACYDCHSHETRYPWYFSVAPVSWWLKHHVEEGREHLNFSTWTDYEVKRQKHKLEECYEEVEEGEMPLWSYTLVHGGLSDDEKQTLITWFKEQEQQSPTE